MLGAPKRHLNATDQLERESVDEGAAPGLEERRPSPGGGREWLNQSIVISGESGAGKV